MNHDPSIFLLNANSLYIMSFVPNLINKILILTVLLVLLPVETLAFGAGDIPDFAYLNGIEIFQWSANTIVLNELQIKHFAMAISRIFLKNLSRMLAVLPSVEGL